MKPMAGAAGNMNAANDTGGSAREKMKIAVGYKKAADSTDFTDQICADP